MNEQLQQQLSEIISQIASLVSQAGSFTLNQLPDIVTQYVLYGRVYQTLICSFAISILSLIGYFTIKYFKPTEGVSITLGFVCSIIPMVILGTNFTDFIMVWFAPKIWLIQQFLHMVK